VGKGRPIEKYFSVFGVGGYICSPKRGMGNFEFETSNVKISMVR
jgi:hypothetical protein